MGRAQSYYVTFDSAVASGQKSAAPQGKPRLAIETRRRLIETQEQEKRLCSLEQFQVEFHSQLKVRTVA